MRNLNCKHATRMMPLHVEGDLPAHLRGEIARHLAVCEECARLAQKFRESRNLLTEACELPDFGAQFYDQIRNTVLDKITRDGVSSKPPFGLRWSHASALALMLVA